MGSLTGRLYNVDCLTLQNYSTSAGAATTPSIKFQNVKDIYTAEILECLFRSTHLADLLKFMLCTVVIADRALEHEKMTSGANTSTNARVGFFYFQETVAS